MKHKGLTLTLALLLSMLFVVSASAADYGVIYDETELLWSEELEELGTEQLPQFTQTYGIDLRVDVLTTLSNYQSLEQAAAAIYDTYDYGHGEGLNGVTLTLLVHTDEDGVALDEWYVYASGDSSEWVTNGPRNVFAALNDLMTEENWAGDAQQDAQMLVAAVTGIKDGMEGFVLNGGVADTIWQPGVGILSERSTQNPDGFPAAGTPIHYVTDTAGLMTAEERQSLEQAARAISEKHGFGVYLMTMDSFRDATDSYDVFDGATTLYQKYDLGIGDERKGLLLLLSMQGRDFSLVTYSDYGNYVFDQETRESMTSYFLDNFADDDWYGGFADYLAVSDEVLLSGPDKLSSEITALTGIIFLIPLIIAVIVIRILDSKMKSVAGATRAETYTGGLDLTNSYDRFTHATETRRKRKEESHSSGGGGSTRSKRSGGFGGTSGKF